VVIYYIKNKKEYLNLTEKVITEIGFGFRIHSPNSSFYFFIFYLFILFYYYSIMFTIYYFIIIKVARSVGLRICSSSRILMIVSLSKEPNKRTQRTQKNRLTYACSERIVIPNFGMSEVTRIQENKRSTSAVSIHNIK